ncbi:hypothetical protein EGS38_00205 [Neisseria chenwenguii]|nr:hypothetical protein EGS38_00205 [Neisseria chenwenguii]
MEIVRDDKQSIVVELLDSDGHTVNPADIDSVTVWVKPPFQDKIFPETVILPEDPENGLGSHLKITFTRNILQKQMWTQAQYGIEIVCDEGPTTVIGGKVMRIY